MIDDREIWACADMLLKQHGENAWFVASQRADELLETGDVAGSRTFARIVGRICELQNMNPDGQVH